MKKIILVIALLMLVTPALATVTITATPAGANDVTISYSVSGETKLVRAFALDISVADPNVKIANISNYKIGESTSGSPGYGIFVGTIQINDANGGVISWGTPVAGPNEPDHPTQLNSKKITLEMGSLYQMSIPANAPLNSGTLCKITLAGCVSHPATSAAVALAENALRGGIVMEDPNIAPTSVVLNGCTVALPACLYVPPGCTCPGDVSGTTPGVKDNLVSIADLSYIVSYLSPAYKTTTPAYTAPVTDAMKCADVSGTTPGRQDNLISIADLSQIVSYLSPAYKTTTPAYTGPCMAAPTPP